MDKQKISNLVDCYCQALCLDSAQGYNTLLKEMIENLVMHYTNRGVKNVSVNNDSYKHYILKPKNGAYSLEDFFLNRLFHNVRQVSSWAMGKGQYNPYTFEVGLEFEKIEKQLDFPPFTAENKALARKKVIMHEFEHGLDVHFINGSNYLDNIYLNLGDLIRKAGYGNECQTNICLAGNDKGQVRLHSGARVTEGEPLLEQLEVRKAIGNGGGVQELMEEIFNESESITVAGCQMQALIPLDNKDGYYIPVYNYESSNYSITPFADMMREILNSEDVFDVKYLNPLRVITSFNVKYSDIFSEYFGSENSPWKTLGKTLQKIKAKASIYVGTQLLDDSETSEQYKDLTECLTFCFERSINEQLSKVPKEVLLARIYNFSLVCIQGESDKKTQEMPLHKKLNDLRNLVNERGLIPVNNILSQIRIASNINTNYSSPNFGENLR